jgi:hypothetical protein
MHSPASSFVLVVVGRDSRRSVIAIEVEQTAAVRMDSAGDVLSRYLQEKVCDKVRSRRKGVRCFVCTVTPPPRPVTPVVLHGMPLMSSCPRYIDIIGGISRSTLPALPDVCRRKARGCHCLQDHVPWSGLRALLHNGTLYLLWLNTKNGNWLSL